MIPKVEIRTRSFWRQKFGRRVLIKVWMAALIPIARQRAGIADVGFVPQAGIWALFDHVVETRVQAGALEVQRNDPLLN
jgi:hypothetical protein